MANKQNMSPTFFKYRTDDSGFDAGHHSILSPKYSTMIQKSRLDRYNNNLDIICSSMNKTRTNMKKFAVKK